MSTPARHPLGEQALHLIREAGERCREIDQTAERAELRAKVDQASIRPLPGTSHLLCENKPLAEEHHGVDREGKPGKIKVYDLTGAAPVHWCRKGIEKRKLPKGKEAEPRK